MEEYVEILSRYLEGKRNCNKILFKLMGRAYRGVNKGRFTWDEVIEITKKKEEET